MKKKLCVECGKRRPDTLTGIRTAGGSYNRAPRIYRSTICKDCVRKLAPTATIRDGHTLVGSARWYKVSIRNLMEEVERE